MFTRRRKKLNLRSWLLIAGISFTGLLATYIIYNDLPQRGRFNTSRSDVGQTMVNQGWPQHNVKEWYNRLPLSFEANQGQTEEPVKFISRGGDATVFLTATEAVLGLRNADFG